MDIQHILYNTVGNDFEKFLGPKDLLTMSKVSKTAREGDLARKFRHLLEVTEKEFEIFKNNNRKKVTIDDFFTNIPLGVIYKNHTLEHGTDFNALLDYYKVGTKTKECVSVEFGNLSDGLEWSDAIFQASIRGREDLVEVLYHKSTRKYRGYEDSTEYKYYPASERLIDLFVKNEDDFIDELAEHNEIDSRHYMFNDVNDHDDRIVFLTLVTCFQEQEVFRRLYREFDERVPYHIEDILNDTSLKYNIDGSIVSNAYYNSDYFD